MIENIVMRKKICLLGDPSVGKTSIIKKFVYNQFSETYVSTIGTEITKKEILLDYTDNSEEPKSYDISFAIWDIIGQKEYRELIKRFYKNAHGALLVCDLSREDTLDRLKEWTSSLFCAIGKIPILFVGNKYDLIESDKFDPDDFHDISCRFGAPWITTSAKNGENVEEAFLMLGKLIIKNSIYFEKMNSLIDVLDAIIVDFCEVNGGLEAAMPLFKQRFTKIDGASLKQPKRDVVETLISELTNITRDKKGKEIADFQIMRFNNWLRKLN